MRLAFRKMLAKKFTKFAKFCTLSWEGRFDTKTSAILYSIEVRNSKQRNDKLCEISFRENFVTTLPTTPPPSRELVDGIKCWLPPVVPPWSKGAIGRMLVGGVAQSACPSWEWAWPMQHLPITWGGDGRWGREGAWLSYFFVPYTGIIGIWSYLEFCNGFAQF